MAKVLSRLDILLHANTANYVREMKRATDQTKKELKSVADYGKLVGGHLGMAFAGLGSAVSISHIMQTADRMQDLASKVRINTQTTEEYNAVLQDLRKISTDYWTAIDGVTDLYASSKRALDSLGASQRQVLDFTRNITMAMSVGGGSAQAQEAALVQLGQAMSMGVLRGQEFNSVSAQAPVIIDLLTDSLKVSRGELRSMAAEGKITSQVMMDAVLGGYDKLQETINKMPTTFAQGIQNIKSQYDFLVDDIMNQNSLLSQNLANAALWIAEHFRTLVSAGAMVGAVWLANVAKNSALVASFTGLTSATLASTRASIANAFSVQGQINAYNVLSTRMMLLRMTKTHYINLTTTAIATTANYARSLVGLATSFNTATAAARLHTLAIAGVATAKRTAMGVGILATRAVKGLGGAFMALGRVIMAHPIIALTAIIGTVIARTEGLEGAIKSLGDAFSVAGILAVDFVGGVVDGLGTAWTATSNYFSGLMGGSANATNFAQTAFGGFFAGTHKGFVGVLQITARVFDLAGATIVTFAQYAWKNISSLGTAIVNVFKGVGNFVAMVFENIINNQINKINVIIDGMNAISGVFGGGTVAKLAQVSIGRMEYGATNFGFGGFTAAVAQNNAHYSETKVVNAYEQVQQSANRASGANLGLAGAMADVASASEKAGKGVNKAGRANKGVAENAKLAQDEIDKLNKAYIEQLQAFQKMEWELHKPFISELDKINFEIEHGEFVHALDKQKEDLRKLANAVDQSKNIDTLRKMDIGWTKEIAMLGKDSSLDELIYDLNDVSNILSTFDKENILSITYDENGEILEKITAYDYYLKQAVNYDISKASHDLNKQNLELYNQLELLTAKDELHRNTLLLQQEEVAFLGKYNGLIEHGFDEQYQEIKAQFERHKQLKEQLFVQTQYNDLIQSLKSEEEKRLDTLKSQLDVLTMHSQVMGATLDMERAKQLISQTVGLATPTNHYDELNAKTSGQYASLDTGLQALLDNERLTEEERIKIKEWGASERAKIEQAHSTAMNSLILSDSENMFGSLASIAKDGLGEQSRLYRAMFAMQQGFAIAQAGLAMQQAISQGLAKGFPTGLADMAMAVSHGAKIVSAIKSIVMPVGQAHDGIMSVPKSGTWNLEKGERVLPRHTAKALDDKLDKIGNGGRPVNVVINNYSGEKTDVQQMPNGDMMVTIGKMIDNKVDARVNQRFIQARRQGGELYR